MSSSSSPSLSLPATNNDLPINTTNTSTSVPLSGARNGFKNYNFTIDHNKSNDYLNIKISSSSSSSSSTATTTTSTQSSIVLSLLSILIVVLSYYYYDRHGSIILSDTVPMMLVSTSMILLLFVINRFIIVEESVMVIDIGMQLSSAFVVFGIVIWKNTKFYSRSSIRNVVINEYFKKFEVIYYICLIVDIDNEKRLIVMFPKLLPRLDMLVEIYNKIQN